MKSIQSKFLASASPRLLVGLKIGCRGPQDLGLGYLGVIVLKNLIYYVIAYISELAVYIVARIG